MIRTHCIYSIFIFIILLKIKLNQFTNLPNLMNESSIIFFLLKNIYYTWMHLILRNLNRKRNLNLKMV